MIELLLALAATTMTPEVPAEDPAMIACLAHASNTGQFREIPSEEIGTNEEFLDAAEGRWCSDEASPYWSVAHEMARVELGLPEGTGYHRDKQRLAEANMHRLLGEAWAVAAPLRDDPPPLTEEQRQRFLLVWNLDNMGEETPVWQASYPAILCAAERLREKQQVIGEMSKNGGTMPAAAIDIVAPECGFGEATRKVAALTADGLPGYTDNEYQGMAEATLSRMLFYATLAERN